MTEEKSGKALQIHHLFKGSFILPVLFLYILSSWQISAQIITHNAIVYTSDSIIGHNIILNDTASIDEKKILYIAEGTVVFQKTVKNEQPAILTLSKYKNITKAGSTKKQHNNYPKPVKNTKHTYRSQQDTDFFSLIAKNKNCVITIPETSCKKVTPKEVTYQYLNFVFISITFSISGFNSPLYILNRPADGFSIRPPPLPFNE